MLFLPIFHTPSPYTAIHFALPTKASYFAPQHILPCFEKDYFPLVNRTPLTMLNFHDAIDTMEMLSKSNFRFRLFLLLRFFFLRERNNYPGRRIDDRSFEWNSCRMESNRIASRLGKRVFEYVWIYRETWQSRGIIFDARFRQSLLVIVVPFKIAS